MKEELAGWIVGLMFVLIIACALLNFAGGLK